MNVKGLAVGFAVLTVLSGLVVVAGVVPAVRSHTGPTFTNPPSASVPVRPATVGGDLGWQTPVPLESQTASNANLAGVALSADGTGMIVWQRGGAQNTLMATRFIPGGGGDAGTNWQVPVQVSTGENSISYVYNGAVAMDSSGDAMAVYQEWNGDGHGYTIYAAFYQDGVGWKAPVPIDQPYDWSYSPVLAMNAFGDAIAVWEVWTGSTYNIFANRYVPGTGWAAAADLSVSSNYSYNPTVAIDGSGNAIAAWYQFDGSTYHVYVDRYSTLTGWAAPLLAETSTNFAYLPSVAMDPEGNGIVTWLEYDSTYTVWAKLYVNTSGWQTATPVESSPYWAYFTPGPATAINRGNAVVVWTQEDSTGTPQVFENRYVSGSGWAGPADIDGTSYPAQDGLVAIDPSGNITITYQIALQGTTPANQVENEAVRYDQATTTWSYSQLDYAGVGTGSALVAIDGKGGALAAWNYNDNGSGNPRNGLLTNYYTAGSGWQYYWEDQQAEWTEAVQPSWLQLETNLQGDAIFSFTQDDGPIWDGYAALYTPSTGWGPVTQIENMTHTSVAEEWSAIDGAGNALVLFRTSDGTQYNVYATYYQVGVGWGPPVRLDNAATSDKYWLRVALNQEGNGVAAWQEWNGTNWNAYAAFFNGTTHTWTAPTEVQSTFSYVGSVVVGIDGHGDAMAVYQVWNGSGYPNYASLYKVGVGWQAPVQVSASGASTGVAYALSMNDAGYATASWGQTNGNRSIAAVNVYSPTAGWGTEATFITAPGDEGPATPSLDAAGDALLAYDAWTGSQWVGYAVTKPVTGSWGSPVQVSSGPGDATGMTSSLDVRGNGYVAWNQYNGVGYDIVARRYVSGIGWGPASSVNQPAPATSATDTGSAILTTDGHGDAVLGWNQWNNAVLLPYAAEYVVGNGSPTLTVTAPANGSLTNRSSVTVVGSTDPGATVTIDGAPVLVALNGSFEAAYTLADGTHTFVVVAKNAAGDTTSVSTTVTVDTTAPAISITSPTTGAVTNNSVAEVTGTTEAGASVSVNGVVATVSPTGSFSVAIPLAEGANTITATARDAAGNSASTSVSVTLDTFPPPLTISSPAAGPTNHSAVTVAGTTEAGATVTVDGSAVTVGPTGAFSTVVSLPDGPHTFVVVATDTAGNRAEAAVSVTVETTPPAISISSPTSGTVTNNSVAEVTGTTEPGASVSVNGVVAAVSPTGSFSVAIALAEGANTITATARDGAGNAASTSVSVTLDTLPPPLTISSPTPGPTNHSSVTVAGTTEAGATVTVDGAAVTVGPTGAFSTVVTLPDGPHTFIVVATDTAGNRAEAEVSVTVETTPPAISISSPTSGAVTNDSVAKVTGTTEPGASVSVNGVMAAVSPTGSFSVVITLSEGANTLTATAKDAAGNSASTSVFVTLDTLPPPLTISSPAAGPTNHSAVTVAGTTEAGATVTVDGAAVTVGPTGAFSTVVTLPDGPHTFVVVATDTAGNRAEADVSVTVETTPPTLAFTSPASGSTVSVPDVVVTGTAAVGSTLVVDGYSVAVSSAGTFSVELPLSPGSNTITATATDSAGNTATRTLTVTYNNPVPGTQDSINSLTTRNDLLFGLVAASLALGAAGLVLRSRRPAGPKGPPKEVSSPPSSETPPK
ncbi:MAG TPA: Ig-like domain-containing protein [Thermoplasmata archaeon]|nr:Ig-like domain-containing protein [Thermoplasmata archaeon]